jgi:hypothetical protein
MTGLSDQWIAVFAVVTSLAIGWMIFRVARARRRVRENLVPHEVRERSHEVANEATKLRAGLRRISKSSDPIKALVEAMAGDRHDRDH